MLEDIDLLKRTVRVIRQVKGATSAGIRICAPKRERGTWLLMNGRSLFQRGSADHYCREARSKVDVKVYTLHDLRHF